MIPVLWKQCNRETDSKMKKKDQKGWRKEKEKRGTCMQVSSQSWPNRMTTRRSSSARIAWSTAHPECRCGNKYDILVAPPLDPPSLSAASRRAVLSTDKQTSNYTPRKAKVGHLRLFLKIELPTSNMGTFCVCSRRPHAPTPYTTRVGSRVSRIRVCSNSLNHQQAYHSNKYDDSDRSASVSVGPTRLLHAPRG